MSEQSPIIFIGIPDLAKKLGMSRQMVHYHAKNGTLPIRSYPLRKNRQITFIFRETDADDYAAMQKEAA